MSEEERRKCYGKHPPDICVSDVPHKFFNTFHRRSAELFQVGISNSHRSVAAIQAGFGATIRTVISTGSAFLGASQREKGGGYKKEKTGDNFIRS